MHISGTMFNYYFVCHRKLWCFYNNIRLEQDSETVMLGKLIDENSYSREHKQIMIDQTINVDFIKDWQILHEVKKSKSIEEASIWQVKYYLYFLEQRGIKLRKGVLDYPKIKKREEVFLHDDDREKIEQIIINIRNILSQDTIPATIDSKICKSCAYCEYCYI